MRALTVLMADQPSPQSPNANRISNMLSDLAAQRAAAQTTPTPTPPIPARPTTPSTPVASSPQRTPPANLPGATSIARPTAPAPAPRQIPNTPMPTRPPMPPPPRPPAPLTPATPVAPRAPIAPTAPAPVRPITPPVPAPNTPSSPQYVGQLRTMAADIGQVSTGRSPMPTTIETPLAPTAPSTAPTIPQPTAPSAPTGIVVPPASGGSFTKKLIYIVLGLAVFAVIAWLLTGLIGNGTTPTTSSTPKPTASVSASATPAGKSLSTYFPKAGPSVNLKNTDSATRDILNTLATAQLTSKQAQRFVLSGDKTTTFADFMGLMGSAVPSALKTALGAEWTALAYGQSEQFDANGSPIANASIKNKIILIAQVTDATGANQATTLWEGTGLASNSATLLGYTTTKAIVRGFSSGTYRQISVRYWNFPYADSSVDWAVMTASNNKNYLIISSSRESLFFAIDQLMQ